MFVYTVWEMRDWVGEAFNGVLPSVLDGLQQPVTNKQSSLSMSLLVLVLARFRECILHDGTALELEAICLAKLSDVLSRQSQARGRAACAGSDADQEPSALTSALQEMHASFATITKWGLGTDEATVAVLALFNSTCGGSDDGSSAAGYVCPRAISCGCPYD